MIKLKSSLNEDVQSVPLWLGASLMADTLLDDCFLGCDRDSSSSDFLSSRRSSVDFCKCEACEGKTISFTDSQCSTNLDLDLETLSKYSPSESPIDIGNSDVEEHQEQQKQYPEFWLENMMKIYDVRTMDNHRLHAIDEKNKIVDDDEQSLLIIDNQMQSDEFICEPKKSVQNSDQNTLHIDTSSNDDDAQVKEIPSEEEYILKAKMAAKRSTKRTIQQINDPSDGGKKQKVMKMASPCFDGRKKEQNRSAALRYRDKRRVEAKQAKEELHTLELRNVELKTEVSWLEKEVLCMKDLLKVMKK